MAGEIITKVSDGNGTHLISNSFYGTCSTAAGTVAKEVIVNDSNITDAITLVNGMVLTVKFTYANGVASPTLTLFNNSGTKASPSKGAITLAPTKKIYRYGTTAPSTSAASSWQAGAIVPFIYDGSAWIEASSWDNDSTALTSMTGTLAVNHGGTGVTSNTVNSVLIGGTTTTGAIQNVAAASGALYSTGANVKPTFGTLPIAQGGTGSTTTAAALTKLGFDAADVTFTTNTTNWTPNTTVVKKSNNVVSVTLTGQAKAGVAAWVSNTYIIGTLSIVPVGWTQLNAYAQIDSAFVPILCAINTDGQVIFRTAGTAVPVNTWIWIAGTYIA